MKRFDARTPETEIADWIDAARAGRVAPAELLALLPEEHPVYQQRSTNQAARLRGYLLVALGELGLPKTAIPYVLAELENGRHAYLVAAAARALRGAARPDARFANYLLQAVENIRFIDDAVNFDSYTPGWPLEQYTTALSELAQTLTWMGGQAAGVVPDLRALLADEAVPLSAGQRQALESAQRQIDTGKPAGDCCEPGPWPSLRAPRTRRSLKEVADIQLIDQDNTTTSFGDFFKGRPALVAFFYTRCTNPNKCSLTVTRLAALQKTLRQRGLEGQVRTAAITYDPAHDTPAVLRAYGENRGLQFDADHRAFTVSSTQFVLLKRYFELGVNYAGPTVNHHRIELFLLDTAGRVSAVSSHLQWDENQILARLTQRQGRGVAALSGAARTVWSAVLPVAVAFFPKCPFCWAAYASMFGLAGAPLLPYSRWWLPVFIGLAIINLWALGRMAWRRGRLEAFYLTLGGIAVFFGLGVAADLKIGLYAGLLGIMLGAAFTVRKFDNLRI